MSDDIRKKFEVEIVTKAQKDEGFRKRLLSDPNGAIRSLGYTLADTTQWHVLEETGGNLFLVLPRPEHKLAAGGTIDDDALEAVAGGAGHGVVPRFAAGCPGCGNS
jgi:hypothetical protein